MIDNSLDDEFTGFDAPPHSLQLGESRIYVPDPMNHLNYLIRHLARHMFVATDSKPLPLKWVADITTLVERHAETMDWDSIRKQDPALLKRLEVLYSLTPLPQRLVTVIPIRQIPPPAGVGQYPQGWPQQVNWGWKMNGFPYYIWRSLTSPTYIWNTLNVPSDWWLRLYYGIDADLIFWYGQVIYRWQVLKMALWKIISQN